MSNSFRFLSSREHGSVGIALLACALLCSAVVAHAQTPAFWNGGAGNSTNVFPFNTAATTKIESRYMPGEFAGAYAGMITKVYWRGTAAWSASSYTNMKIWMGQTTNSSFPSTNTYTTAGMTLQYSAASVSVPAGAAGAWFGFTLTTPFQYDPTKALIVISCHEGYTGGITVRTSTSTVPPYRRIYGAGGAACAGTTGTSDQYNYDFGFDLSSAYLVDAGIQSLVSPVNFCASAQDIKVTLMNYGKNTLNSVTIKWNYDGTPQSDINWTGALASLSTQEVTLGNRTFAGGVPHALKVWTRLPNNASDSGAFNDTLTTTLKPALSGTFTIGGATPSYPTFASAAADLTANGICGPVVFNVRSGTYTETINLSIINGASAVNTVTFQSESGNRNDVTLTHAPTTQVGTVNMTGADWVTFQNMSIKSTGTTYSNVLIFSGGSDHNNFLNCVLQNPAMASTSTANAVIFSSTGMDEYNSFVDNAITGGSIGAYWFGSGATAATSEMMNRFERNTITGQYYFGLYTYYQNTITLKDNLIIRDGGYTYAYLCYAYYYFGPYVITGNKMIAKNTTYTYGLMNYANGSVNSPTSRPIIANNFITTSPGTSTCYGLYLYYLSYALVYNNTVYNRSTYASSYSVYNYYGDNFKFKNNIIYAPGGGYVYYIYNPTGTWESDYNILYTTGATFGYLYPPGTTYANFALYQSGSGKEANSKNLSNVLFADAPNGDLHLAGTSQNDPNLTGIMLPEVTDDIDKDVRVLPYIGADEACYILPNTVTYEFRDATGAPTPYANVPGTVYVYYKIAFPAPAASITATLKLFNPFTNQLVYSTTFPITKLANQTAEGTQPVSIPSTVPPGAYKAEVVFYTMNSCEFYIDYSAGLSSLLIVPEGQVPCIVWPGDANNDGIVNFGDRKALNQYIQDANLSATWLSGPNRYRADFATNPLTYFTWVGQASSPWATPMGCYMDTDGNGMINNFDYLAMKLNWMRTHGNPKNTVTGFSAGTFDLDQNYPNPFNPTTTLRYNAPERSSVTLTVTDMLGRTVASLVNGMVDAGTHSVVFDASTLESGGYIATITMAGEASGQTFTKTIKMSLLK